MKKRLSLAVLTDLALSAMPILAHKRLDGKAAQAKQTAPSVAVTSAGGEHTDPGQTAHGGTRND